MESLWSLIVVCLCCLVNYTAASAVDRFAVDWHNNHTPRLDDTIINEAIKHEEEAIKHEEEAIKHEEGQEDKKGIIEGADKTQHNDSLFSQLVSEDLTGGDNPQPSSSQYGEYSSSYPSSKYEEIVYFDDRRYDFIVIGGGTAGIPVAAVLAGLFDPAAAPSDPKKYAEHSVQGMPVESTQRFPTVSVCVTPPCAHVLVLEAGKENGKEVPSTQWYSTANHALLDPMARDVITTQQGVRVMSPRVLGGASSMSLGVMQREGVQYFEDLKNKFGVDINFEDMSRAYDIAQAVGVSTNIPEVNTDWDESMALAYEDVGFGQRIQQDNSEVVRGTGRLWDSYRLPADIGEPANGQSAIPPINFVEGEPQQPRVSSMAFLGGMSKVNLNIQVESEVEKLLFTVDEVTGELVAQCVVYKVTAETNSRIHERVSSARSAQSITQPSKNISNQDGIMTEMTEESDRRLSVPSDNPVEVFNEVFSGLFESVTSGVQSLIDLLQSTFLYTNSTTDNASHRSSGNATHISSASSRSAPDKDAAHYHAKHPSSTPGPYITRKVCLQNSLNSRNGRIVMSAGAVWTPTILFKSGIGPRPLLERFGIPVILDVPLLGQNAYDKPVVNAAGFFSSSTKDRLLSMINKHAGANYFDVTSVDPVLPCEPGSSPNCRFIQITSHVAGYAAEYSVAANREVVPPSLRSSPLLEPLFQAYASCPVEKQLEENDCPLVRAYVKCGRQASVFQNILAYPQSRGEVTMDRHGRPVVDFKYFSDPRDMATMKAGMRKVMELLQSDSLSDYFEGQEQKKCEELYSPANVLALLELINDPELRSRIYSTSDAVTQQMLDWFIPASSASTNLRSSTSRPADLGRGIIRPRSTTERSSENSFYPRYPTDSASDSKLEMMIKSHYFSSQQYAGTAAMNSVVGPACGMLGGFANVDIADASILPQLPRGAPMGTVMSMGIYCGERINRKWRTPQEEEPTATVE
eukprot:GHVQ01020258.1.p1 GENE.GHVQ01020258.1~~GHVQ01020258.1.p1  ORF type:complete len:974 (-),score=175.28 GHVQ01020258.1:1323-4244(-)